MAAPARFPHPATLSRPEVTGCSNPLGSLSSRGGCQPRTLFPAPAAEGGLWMRLSSKRAQEAERDEFRIHQGRARADALLVQMLPLRGSRSSSRGACCRAGLERTAGLSSLVSTLRSQGHQTGHPGERCALHPTPPGVSHISGHPPRGAQQAAHGTAMTLPKRTRGTNHSLYLSSRTLIS